ncbi:hypothetical protein [Levilactobacillus spicheri]|uniref:Secreted protein n=2 Tax=Levilactobacillus spicheri TaxID=216463 RepID=A0ABQ0WVZ5_9LACO|nr:hypothetical protein [Levilactobacillus spicheri]KRL48455.1 hypothetical protein FD37_GL001589 [Levilactobacillus spicheri DSM 15429]GEO67071.1 hypothetical protein LSP04_14900 [Levilactobacillus spicheri]
MTVVKLMLAGWFWPAYIKAEFWRSAYFAELQNRAHHDQLARRREAGSHDQRRKVQACGAAITVNTGQLICREKTNMMA